MRSHNCNDDFDNSIVLFAHADRVPQRFMSYNRQAG